MGLINNPVVKPLVDFMLQTLKFFAGMSGGNYGLAIILLTAAVKLALYPLTLQSIQQMAALQRLQPKMQELQKKLKDKPEELQKKTMELYKSEKVNPFGGCLPMLLQMPFFLALYGAVFSPEFKALLVAPGAQASFLWIKNLATPDIIPFLAFGKTIGIPVSAILIGITSYFAQTTMPGMKAQQSAMTYFFPLFMAYISIYFPAGAQLYWLAQTVFSIIQQLYIARKV
jgi:YidC/Oxa1 family membrane protein insertase